MSTKLRNLGVRTLAGAVVAGGPAIAACSVGPTYDQWAATDGAAGRINLDDVQDAFKKSESATEFEQRVNRIYEGDGLVLIRAKQDGDDLTLEGWEDLDKDNEIGDTSDDLLFTVVKKGEEHELRGHGANGYYSSGFGPGSFLFTYLLISSIGPRGYYYSTPRGYAGGGLNRSRSNYRNTNSYRSQVSRNSKYFNSQKNSSFTRSKYNSAANNQGTARRSYQSTQQRTGGFKSSSTGVRSSWGSAGGRSVGSRGGGRGGFRGGGGGQVIIGSIRPAG